MSIAASLPTYLPYFRRFARSLTGSEECGDRYALGALEVIAADPDRMNDEPEVFIRLYRLMLETWLSDGAPSCPSDQPDIGVGMLAAGRHLDAMSPLPRAAFLLRWVEGLTAERISRIMDCSVTEVNALTEQAGREIAAQITTDVLIIEDEPIISMDVEAMVTELGHRVVGVARTRGEALAATQQHLPGLVLADIHLGDASSGLDAVNDILAHQPVPVVFITAYPERLQLGARPEPTLLISKPYHSETVKAAISRVLFFDAKAHLDLRDTQPS
jgi:CheY-like chemotaxis protein